MQSPSDKFGKAIRRFDVFFKTHDDYRVQTVTGSTISIASGLVILILLVSEFQYYLATSEQHELFVDPGGQERLRIHVDITFPKMPCDFLSVDVMDVTGSHQLDVGHNVFKKRLDSRGRAIAQPNKEEKLLRDQETPKNNTVVRPEGYCGSCYGAIEGCCNTCADVQEAYRKKGWAFGTGEGIKQCEEEGYTQAAAKMKDEGCNMFGYLEVRRVAGNFHFAPGKAFQQNHMHVHDLQPFKGGRFDMSHRINRLTFGEVFPGAVNPLDGRTNNADLKSMGSTMFQYYVKIVPTTYEYLYGRRVSSNSYSVTEHQRNVGQGVGHGLPGVFFMYDMSPIMVKITQKQKSFGHFLTGVCAIVGGVFTVAGMLDSFVFASMKSLKKKIDLGKAA